ncbi:MAG: hypothetical protein ABI882_08095 [Acidobacteriota bacterium]
MRSLEILLTDSIDYAGLFPPAELEMQQAVARYADYRHSAEAWMLGRFITPVARLDEFERAADAHLDYDSDSIPWKLSVLAGSDPVADLAAISEFNRRHTLDPELGAFSSTRSRRGHQRLKRFSGCLRRCTGLSQSMWKFPSRAIRRN